MNTQGVVNAISIKGLKKSFKDLEVLKGIDLAIPQGSILALLGPNGAGKTTTAKTATRFQFLAAIAQPAFGLTPEETPLSRTRKRHTREARAKSTQFTPMIITTGKCRAWTISAISMRGFFQNQNNDVVS